MNKYNNNNFATSNAMPKSIVLRPTTVQIMNIVIDIDVVHRTRESKNKQPTTVDPHYEVDY